MKEVSDQNLWNFELGSQESVNVPIWILIGFQQRDRQDSQNLKNDNFRRLPSVMGTEKNPDAGIFLKTLIMIIFKVLVTLKRAFRALTKDDILRPYISNHDFSYSNVRVDGVGYNLHDFDIRYQQNFTASQPNEIELKLDGVAPNDINGFALVLTNKLVSINSDGQRHFDLI